MIDHVGAGEGLAGVEGDILAEVEGPGLAVLAALPAFREVGLDLHDCGSGHAEAQILREQGMRAKKHITLDEIGREVRDEFLHAGGENFSHIPCLNDSPEGMAVIETLARRELSGWV